MVFKQKSYDNDSPLTYLSLHSPFTINITVNQKTPCHAQFKQNKKLSLGKVRLNKNVRSFHQYNTLAFKLLLNGF